MEKPLSKNLIWVQRQQSQTRIKDSSPWDQSNSIKHWKWQIKQPTEIKSRINIKLEEQMLRYWKANHQICCNLARQEEFRESTQ